MKRFLLILMCCFLLVGCGGKPSGMSDEMYDIGIYVVDVVDSYLKGRNTVEEAYALINDLYIPDCDDIGSVDWEVSAHILYVQIALFGVDLQTQTISELKEERNELAELINYK